MPLVGAIVRPIVSAIARPVVDTGAVPGPGPELITNGALASAANWTTGTGWSIAGGVASYAGGAGVGDQLSQGFGALVAPTVNGTTYRLQATCAIAGCRAILSGGAGTQMQNLAFGANSFDIVATDARTTIAFENVDGDAFTIDNVSLRTP